MGLAKQEMIASEDELEVTRLVRRMAELQALHPRSNFAELHLAACDSLEDEEREEELARKLEKDD